MKKKIVAIGSLSLLASLGVASAAQAQSLSSAPTGNWYGSYELGAGRLSSSAAGNGLAANGQTATGIDQDRTRTAMGLSLGYQFTPNFALEGGYVDLGHYNYGAATGTDNLAGRWKADGLKLVGVASMPLARDFSAYAKAGVLFSHTEFDGYGTTTAFSQEKDRVVPTVGLGVAYALTPRLDATAGWDRYQGLGADATTGKGNVDAYSVGLKYKF